MNAYVWALLAAACWGCAPLVEKAGLRGAADPGLGVFLRSLGVLVGGLAMAVLSPDVIARARALPGRQWLYLMCGGLLASILGQLLFYRALKTGEVSRVTPIAAAYPVLTFVLGTFFLHESVTIAKAVGLGFVVVGVFLLR